MTKLNKIKGGVRRDITHGIKWTVKEAAELKKLFLKKKKTIRETMKLLNKKFWKGKTIRTYGSIEKKLQRESWFKRENSVYNKGKISAKQKKIWELKKVHGLTFNKIAEIMHIPVGSVKSSIAYLKHHTITMI